MSEDNKKQTIVNSIMKTITKYVESGPFFLNPDGVVVENIVLGLADNRIRYGYAYCPCRSVSGIPQNDKKNICPCRSHKEEIKRQGSCECGLFVSKDYLMRKAMKREV